MVAGAYALVDKRSRFVGNHFGHTLVELRNMDNFVFGRIVHLLFMHFAQHRHAVDIRHQHDTGVIDRLVAFFKVRYLIVSTKDIRRCLLDERTGCLWTVCGVEATPLQSTVLEFVLFVEVRHIPVGIKGEQVEILLAVFFTQLAEDFREMTHRHLAEFLQVFGGLFRQDNL